MSTSAGHDSHLRTYNNEDPSVGQLASQFSEQVTRLVRNELALAQFEAKRKAKRVGVGVGMFGGSGMLAFYGVGCLVAAAILGIAVTSLSGWLAALIVAGGLFVLAGLMALIGRQNVRRGTPPIPTEAVESTKADVAAVRQAVKR